MKLSNNQQTLLRMLPGVDLLLEQSKKDTFFEGIPNAVVVNSIRQTLDSRRNRILAADPSIDEQNLSDSRIMELVKESAAESMTPNLKSLINATGVVVHTNLGRSLVPAEVIQNLAHIAGRYSNLEYDLGAGKRGSRYGSVEDILCEISGAAAGMVVNNNAAAVLLCLETLARGKEVIVSRGELVEIGGSFRVPDVMAKSGGILKEVGTTNRTHMQDYENALAENTALMLKVHRSNYSVIGFTAEVSLKELVELGTKHGLPVMEDLGSGTFIDFSKYGLIKEPTVQESVAAGVDVVTFSGDKLLGGPQAGIIVGKKQILDRIKQNPLARALRIDKMTLAALEATLRLYRDEDHAVRRIPTLQMLTMNLNELANRATRLADDLNAISGSRLEINQVELSSKAGGGALPLLELPSKCLRIKIQGLSANKLEQNMRQNTPPIIGRIENDAYVIDPRTLLDDDLPIIRAAFEKLLN
ncbi:L-seryl-tRNA(Sec) selenium transferase (EC [Olavius sp. associated proteobacterium Delta 1]|nr:L-seryl-tRNA(Sec) selenium transferase (EC [Olavius sp. associated proteobacterium Delta 1]